MADIERNIFFYEAQLEDPDRWRRADILRGLEGIQGSPSRYMDVRGGDVVFVLVDRIPSSSTQYGRIRLFRVRRTNLPAVEDSGALTDLPIPTTAGLAEPSHVVFGPSGLVAAEYNHFAPRITALAAYLNEKLDLDVHFATFVQRDIVDRLDRLRDIRLLELSVKPSQQFREEINVDDPVSQAVYAATNIPGERRVAINLSGDYRSEGFSETLRSFARRLLAHGEEANEGEAGDGGPTVFKVRGYDPASDEVEVLDLLKQKVVRRVELERESPRSRALNTSSAYDAIEAAAREARDHDLPDAYAIS